MFGDVETAFSRVEILGERVSEIPAHDEVRPNTAAEQQQDQQYPDRISSFM
jgi:hypothetical protein